ncbi:MAG: hypothetical protein QOI27_1307 [Gaiellaceae bacterium]|jgi:hypothetical protein|nr:hypothetical protein [Gaiellaceae bacterium]MDX6471669.1 hypothetical protein [Gaiellaceae bacterium]
MAEQSHRDEMNAAIRAQRERHAAPRTIAPTDEPAPAPVPAPEPEVEPTPAEPPRKRLLDRLRGR